ncbi:HAD-IA family hydrolase [Shinella kummerowiae]|uniref:phosphoglycolate phosphatase n=1 Tax=Shinella kummerowiae TaxID=417745 RepID=A0A6N8SMU3_9HYPH|nr:MULTISPECIES: HAD family hydrolase [Rhizobiaceae]AOF90151.1 HAD hydrolase, IA, variant 1 family protein [Sinorhizobium sp. RAC02]MXN48180.1 HAD-IA family hydrolase [Shinella kummerowiae]
MTKAATISGILFDKDGTLLDYARSWVPVNYELARVAALGDEDLARKLLVAGGMDPDTGHVMPDSLLAAGNTVEIAEGFVAAGAPFTVEALTIHFDGLFANSAQLAVAVTDLADFFATMHARGYWLGVASSDNEASIRATAKRFGFENYLHYVAGYDSGFGIKPEAGMVLGFCAATGLEPHQVAVVGDNNHDMHMGRNAGAGLTVAVLTGTGSRESLADASDYCLNDITELVPLFPEAAAARPAA